MVRYFVLLTISLATPVFSQTQYGVKYDLYSQDGTYLGHTGNKYDFESIYNPYGQYGSKFSSTSIWNTYGEYGSRYSMQSWRNTYTFESPIIRQAGQYIGRLGGSKYQLDSYDLYDLNDPVLLPGFNLHRRYSEASPRANTPYLPNNGKS